MKRYGMLAVIGVGGAVAACCLTNPVRAAEPIARAQAEIQTAPPQSRAFTGIIRSIDPRSRTIQVKVVFAQRTFTVPPGIPIETRTKKKAGLDDLKVGDEVEMVYEFHGVDRVALSIGLRGSTPNDRREARERERLQKILTPTPSERGLE